MDNCNEKIIDNFITECLPLFKQMNNLSEHVYASKAR